MTESLLESILNDSFSDGMLIRNMEELLIYKEYVNKNKDNCAKKIVLDSNIYVYNKETKIFLLEEYRDMCIDRIASPIELDENELSDLVNEVPITEKWPLCSQNSVLRKHSIHVIIYLGWNRSYKMEVISITMQKITYHTVCYVFVIIALLLYLTIGQEILTFHWRKNWIAEV